MKPRRADLLLTAALAGGGALIIEHVDVMGVRLAFALLMLLVLPGYAVTQASFANRPTSRSHLVLLTLTLSISVSILAALVLSLATNGLRTGSWLVVIVVVVMGACWLAFQRRESPAAPTPRPARARVRFLDVVCLAVAAGVVVGAVKYSQKPLPAKHVQGYTALSILPSADDKRPKVQLGVKNEEQHAQTYRLDLTAGSKVVFAHRLITLVPGARWDATVDIAAAETSDTYVEAVLYRNEQPGTQYRSVHVWLSPSGHEG